MLTYLILCIALTGIFCIVLAYFYLVAASRKNEISEIVKNEVDKNSPNR